MTKCQCHILGLYMPGPKSFYDLFSIDPEHFTIFTDV